MVGKKKPPATIQLPFCTYEITILGTKATLYSDDPGVQAILTEVTSYRVKDYRFSPKYKSGQWDGKVRMGRWFRSRFTFPTGLIPYVVQKLEDKGFSTTFKDERRHTEAQIPPLMELEGITLWQHQEETVTAGLRKALEGELIHLPKEEAKFLHGSKGKACRFRNPGMGIVWVATGGGKTEAIAALIGRLARPTLFVVYGGDLIRQTYKRFESRFGDWLSRNNQSMGIVSEGELTYGFVTVASVPTLGLRLMGYENLLIDVRKSLRDQIVKSRAVGLAQKALMSFQNRWKVSAQLELCEQLTESDPLLGKIFHRYILKVEKARKKKIEVEEFLKRFDVLVYDEAHGAGGDGGYAVSMACAARYRYALSATPLDRSDSDNWRVVAAFGDPIVRIRTKLLVDQGILPRAKIFIVKVEGSSKDRWPRAYKRGIVEHEARLNSAGLIAQHHIEQGEKVLILFQQIKHGENLLDVCDRYNLNACLIDGASSQDERDEGVADLLSGEIDVLIASDIFKQGVDSKGFDVVINQAGGKATIDTMQRFGRGLRGDKLTVYDYADGHNKYTSRHSAERLKIYIDYDCFPIEWATQFNC